MRADFFFNFHMSSCVFSFFFFLFFVHLFEFFQSDVVFSVSFYAYIFFIYQFFTSNTIFFSHTNQYPINLEKYCFLFFFYVFLAFFQTILIFFQLAQLKRTKYFHGTVSFHHTFMRQGMEELITNPHTSVICKYYVHRYNNLSIPPVLTLTL